MPARILIVEDNPNNLELMSFLLEAFGHVTLRARDGEEGLEIAQRESVDLVLCDVQMPRMSGHGLLACLRADPDWKTPIIAVTALAMVGDRERVLGAGFDGYIPKPIAPETFVAEVERFLGREPTAAPIQASPAPAEAPATSAARRATILIVDDSPDNLAFLCSTLEPFGYVLVTARSAADALLMASARPPDLIVSDLHMPQGSGLELIRSVKADPALASIPFVFLSSTDWTRKSREEGLALGAARFIQRPIEPQALLALIASCLEPERAE